MKLTIRHTLTFSLGTPPRAVAHLLLTPTATPQQKVVNWTIEMPGFGNAAAFRDGFGNRAHLVTQVKPEAELVVMAGGTVETVDRAGVLGRLDYDPMPALFRRQTAATTPDATFIDGLPDGDGPIAMLHALMGRVHDGMGSGSPTTAPGPSSQVDGGQSQLQSQGTGKDAELSAAVHAFIGAARAIEVPARYVTGYLLDGGKASFHAWAEAWDEGLGWIGFDPVLNLCPTEAHVRLAAGLDAMGTMPVRTVPAWGAMPVETVEISAAE
jgi:transglutaminase-like putative cysteine protease